MPVANLPDVTAALTRLLVLNIARLSGTSDIDVTNLPPERADEVAGTNLNLHLYLASFDADGGTGVPYFPNAAVPMSTVPLPLKLFYVMTAHATLADSEEADIVGQQTAIGWGMKTFHDFPEIRDTTRVGPDPVVLSGDIFGSRGIEVILRPVTPEESVSFWSTDQVRTARLAAYYEVRTLLLPPELPETSGGPVADVALGVFAGGPPVLRSGESEQRFEQPQQLGGASVTAIRSPAVPMLRSMATSDDALMRIAGLGLGDGSDAALVLRGEQLTVEPVVLIPEDNSGWGVVLTDTSLVLRVRPSANVLLESGPATIALLPGIYMLSVSRTRELTNEDRTVTRLVEQESNRIPFAIAPAIIRAELSGGLVEIEIDPAYDATTEAAIPRLAIGGTLYREVDTLVGEAGTFAVHNGSEYRALPLAGVALDTAVRLSVNGVDAQPAWIGLTP